jgi:branched-chain amino acid transport system ATP-binding protein
MLDVDELTMAYGPIEVVHDLSLHVDEGAIVTVLGRNGAGKTTTLNGIAGVLRPVSGDVRLSGTSIIKKSISEIARMGVAYVPEGRGVFPTLTVWENLAAAAYGHDLRGRAATAEIRRALDFMPALESRTKQRAGTMSGGEQQMLVLARALLSRPRLLLVDEPGLGLSPLLVSQVYEHLVRFNRDDGLSILLVEQYVDLAINTASHAFVLEKGRVAHSGACADLKQSKELVSAYVG